MRVEINGREIGDGQPTYIVAEMSANHHQDFDTAVKLVRAAGQAGADAVKVQCYTPDTMTIKCDNKHFRIKGTPWDGQTLYELYSKAYMPWEWILPLQVVAQDCGLTLFATVYDRSSVDFLEGCGVPAYKVASFELVDIALIRYIVSKGKPVIMSTGMAGLAEVGEAVYAARDVPTILLKCTSAYPSVPEEMNLRTIPDMRHRFRVSVGLSDHGSDERVPIVAVALGACLIEKHLILSRSEGGPDSSFSLEPDEFTEMVRAVRATERAIGLVTYRPTRHELPSMVFRRSLFAVKDIKAGESFTDDNVRSIRPSGGLSPSCIEWVKERRAVIDIKAGTPLAYEHLEK